MLKEDENIIYKNINWSNCTMLLVDDNHACSLLIQELLAETKIYIIETRTGEDAISVFQLNKNIDIVLLDIKLPGIDGFEVFRQIRKIDPNIPVIAHTALNLNTIANSSEIDRFDDTLLKPICVESLFCFLRKYLKILF